MFFGMCSPFILRVTSVQIHSVSKMQNLLMLIQLVDIVARLMEVILNILSIHVNTKGLTDMINCREAMSRAR